MSTPHQEINNNSAPVESQNETRYNLKDRLREKGTSHRLYWTAGDVKLPSFEPTERERADLDDLTKRYDQAEKSNDKGVASGLREQLDILLKIMSTDRNMSKNQDSNKEGI